MGGPRALTVEEIYAKMLAGSIMNPLTDCLEWQGAVNNGYPHFKWAGARHYLHRFIYTIFVEEPKGIVRHKCDNPRCWNPAHLIDGTQQDNMNDMVERGRQALGTYHGRAILTEAQVLEIRDSVLSPQELADGHSVGKTTILHILSGKNWKHLL